MNGELLGEVVQGIKTVAGIEAFLVLPVAALHLTVVARGIGADELVSDAQLGSGRFKQGRAVPFVRGETVGEFRTVVGLDTFHPDAPAGIPLDQSFEEVS